MLFRIDNSRAVLVALALAGHFVLAECVVVENPPKPVFVQSSGRLRLNVRKEGSAVPDSVVTVWKQDAVFPYSISVADKHGIVALKHLPKGKYWIGVLDENARAEASVNVEVSSGGRHTVSSSSMQIGSGVTSSGTRGAVKVQHFRGVVVDPSGGPVPGAKIGILRQGTPGMLLESSSGSDGSFSLDLADGEYWAFVREPGFRTRILRFVISMQGTESLSVPLQIGDSC